VSDLPKGFVLDEPQGGLPEGFTLDKPQSGLPEGFTLDEPQSGLPEGFTLDKPQSGLPEGFTLDEPQSGLPEGFTLDEPKEKRGASVVGVVKEFGKGVTGAVATLPAVGPGVVLPFYEMATSNERSSLKELDNQIGWLEAKKGAGQSVSKPPYWRMLFSSDERAVELQREADSQARSSGFSRDDDERLSRLHVQREKVLRDIAAGEEAAKGLWSAYSDIVQWSAEKFGPREGMPEAERIANLIGSGTGSLAIAVGLSFALGPQFGANTLAMQQAVDTYATQRAKGISPENAALTAGLDFFLTKKLEQIPLEVLTDAARSLPRVARAAVGFVAEGGQEVVQNMGSNLLRGDDVMTGIGDAGIAGGGAGFIVGAFTPGHRRGVRVRQGARGVEHVSPEVGAPVSPGVAEQQGAAAPGPVAAPEVEVGATGPVAAPGSEVGATGPVAAPGSEVGATGPVAAPGAEVGATGPVAAPGAEAAGEVVSDLGEGYRVRRGQDGKSHTLEDADGNKVELSWSDPDDAQILADVNPDENHRRVSEAVAGWNKERGGGPVQVVALRSVDEISDSDVRDRLVPGAEGVYIDQAAPGEPVTVYVFSDSVTPQRAPIVAAHEAVGHAGLRAVLGEKLDATLDEIYGGSKQSAVEEVGRRLGLDLSTVEGQREATEELLAETAELQDSDPSMWQRVVASLKGTLRELGLGVGWTDADIAVLLAKSRDYVAGKRAGATGDVQSRDGVPDVGSQAEPNVQTLEETGARGETTTALGPEFAVQELPLNRLKLSKDVPNFKAGADESGVVDPLAGKYQRLWTAPIVVWERANGGLEIITGRHRADLARRSGERTIPAQVVREASGFTREMALTFDAESNIRDNQGSAKDYANYFRHSETTFEEASSRGLLARDKGRAGFDIGKYAGDDLYAVFADGKISEAKAAAIARAAPSNPGLQAVGIEHAKSHTAAETANYMRSVETLTPVDTPAQLDLFGRNETWQIEADKMSKAATSMQRGLESEQAALNAAKRLGKAAHRAFIEKYGIDPGDSVALRERQNELARAILEMEKWYESPEMVARVRERAGLRVAGDTDAGPTVRMSRGIGTSQDRAVIEARDREYLDAVERGDMQAAQRMVDEMARRAGESTETDKMISAANKEQKQIAKLKERIAWLKAHNADDAELLTVENNAEQREAIKSTIEDRKSEISRLRQLIRNRYESIKYYDADIQRVAPVLRDAAGNVIPLSKRFDAAKPDIRFSRVRSGIVNAAKRRMERQLSGDQVVSQFAERMARSNVLTDDEARRLIERPTVWHERQNLTDITADLKQRSDAQLGSDLHNPNSDVAGLAGAELIQREIDAGRDPTSLIDALASRATLWGQLLRQMAEIKGATPQGLLSVLERGLRKQGYGIQAAHRPVLERQAANVIFTTQALRSAERLHQRVFTAQTLDALKVAESAAYDARGEWMNSVLDLSPPSVAKTIKTMIRGNLLRFKSQVRNVTANPLYNIWTDVGDSFGAMMDALDSMVTGRPRALLNPMTGTVAGVKAGTKALGRALAELVRGPVDGSVQGEPVFHFRPIRALGQLFTKAGSESLPILLKTGEVTAKTRIMKFIEGTVGIPAETMLRLLPLTDNPVREFKRAKLEKEFQALRRKIGETRGLQGAALDQYSRTFDPDTLKTIDKESRSSVFQQDNILASMFYAAGRAIDGKVPPNVAAALSVAATTQMPYIKTPTNLMVEGVKFMAPELSAGIGIYKLWKGGKREGYQYLGRALIASMLHLAAAYLVREGLASGDAEDKSGKLRKLQSWMGANVFNVSAFNRKRNGEGSEWREGDKLVSVLDMGIFGMILRVHASRAYRERGEAWRRYEQQLPPIEDPGLLDKLFPTPFALPETIKAAMQMSTLKGTHDLLNGLSDPDKLPRWWRGTTEAISAGLGIPNEMKTFASLRWKYIPDYQTDNWRDQLVETIRARFANTGMPAVRGLFGEPRPTTPVGADPLVYHTVDILNSKIIEPNARYRAMMDVWSVTRDSEAIPSPVERTLKNPHTGVEKKLSYRERARADEIVGKLRGMYFDAALKDPRWSRLPMGERLRLMKDAYSRGRSEGIQIFFDEQRNPDMVRTRLNPRLRNAIFTD